VGHTDWRELADRYNEMERIMAEVGKLDSDDIDMDVVLWAIEQWRRHVG
jgi:hypothetical protein